MTPPQCPTGYSRQNQYDERFCLNAAGYTAEEVAAMRDRAFDRCRADLPKVAAITGICLLLPGWWKAPALAALALAMSFSDTFGAASCPSAARYLLERK